MNEIFSYFLKERQHLIYITLFLSGFFMIKTSESHIYTTTMDLSKTIAVEKPKGAIISEEGHINEVQNVLPKGNVIQKVWYIPYQNPANYDIFREILIQKYNDTDISITVNLPESAKIPNTTGKIKLYIYYKKTFKGVLKDLKSMFTIE